MAVNLDSRDCGHVFERRVVVVRAVKMDLLNQILQQGFFL
jgi:hypothetical protein